MRSLALVIESDKDIIREFSSGNREMAATVFVRKYQKFVYSTAFRYLQSYDDADDAAQEVFIKALSNIHKFRGDSSIRTWLYRITTNYCATAQKRKKLFSFFKNENKEEEAGIASDDFTPQESLENAEFEERFLATLSKLPEKQRETFALRYFDNMTYEEISNSLGTSVGGLKANYFQAVKKLTELLKKEIN